MKKRILFVDDDPNIAESAKDILEDAGYIVDVALTCQAARAFLNNEALPDVMLIDYNMPDCLGTDLALETHRRFSTVPLIFMSGEIPATISADAELFRFVLTKPVDPATLLTLLDTLLSE